ncbi:MAG: membrane domain protein, partial [Pseudomonadota bacterium]
MAHYLRDERVTNLSINADNLAQLSAVFADRADALNAKVPENDDSGKKAFLTYIIRFDNKGYRVFSLEDLLRYFRLAKEVERVLFTVETGESLRSNRLIGTYLELRVDEKDPNACFLAVTSDDKDWVDASFSAVQDVLIKCKNRNGWARSAWTHFGVQIVGVTFGFILSLWAAGGCKKVCVNGHPAGNCRS